MEAREAELLPVPYFHVVFTLPTAIADIAYQNKRVIYDLLLKASAKTMLTIATDPKHLGAKIGMISVLHTWGSAMTHHPHVHMIVPGGGLSPDGNRWMPCKPGFFLAVRVLSKLFRRLMLEKLVEAHNTGKLNFQGRHVYLGDTKAFKRFLRPLRRRKWYVDARPPFAGPKSVLAYLSRYTHRVAISNRRIIKADANDVTFRYKDYRSDGPARYKSMTLHPHEFIRRFLVHVLPKGLHRIRHYGLFANGNRADNLARMRALLGVTAHDDVGLDDTATTMFMLRRHDAHHRSVRGRSAATSRGNARRDRQLMTTNRFRHSLIARQPMRCNGGLRPDQHSADLVVVRHARQCFDEERIIKLIPNQQRLKVQQQMPNPVRPDAKYP